MLNKTILILGASGLVGRDLVKYLSQNYKVIALSRNKQFLNKIKSNKIKTIDHDLKKKINKNINPEIIINCIVTHSISRKKKFNDYIDSNIISPLNMIAFAKKRKTRLIINLSSVTAYGRPKDKILYERTEPKELDLLGITKFFTEQALHLQRTNFINLRMPGILCNSYDKRRPWLNEIIYKIKNNKHVNIYNANSNFNNVISSYEIYRFIKFIINKNIKIRSTYNFSATKPIKLINVIKKIKEFYNSKSEIHCGKSKKKSFEISTSKIEKKIKFKIDSTNNILEKYLKKNYLLI